MTNAIRRSTADRRWAQNLYLGVAGLILAGILTAGMLIGPSLFAATSWGRKAHGDLGGLVFLLTLLLPIIGLVARLSGRTVLLSAVLFVLALLQVTSPGLGRTAAPLAAIHPANAMLMAGLAVVLAMLAWRERRHGYEDEAS